MQTPATHSTLPVSNAAESINIPARWRIAIACGFLLLALAMLALAAAAPAGHDVPGADTFLNFP
jgi:hypothetical protein